MKAYVMTTGTVFGLIVVAHIWRALAEGLSIAENPLYILLTVAAAALALWAGVTLRPRPVREGSTTGSCRVFTSPRGRRSHGPGAAPVNRGCRARTNSRVRGNSGA